MNFKAKSELFYRMIIFFSQIRKHVFITNHLPSINVYNWALENEYPSLEHTLKGHRSWMQRRWATTIQQRWAQHTWASAAPFCRDSRTDTKIECERRTRDWLRVRWSLQSPSRASSPSPPHSTPSDSIHFLSEYAHRQHTIWLEAYFLYTTCWTYCIWFPFTNSAWLPTLDTLEIELY